MKKPLVILTGPTAVGKTALSIKLAKQIHGEIISADSMQVYKYMDIGTAKITEEEMQKMCLPEDTAAQWLERMRSVASRRSGPRGDNHTAITVILREGD